MVTISRFSYDEIKMGIYDHLKQLYRDRVTFNKMERLFKRKPDPYGYFTHPHELKKQDTVFSLLKNPSPNSAMEIGCAEGAFTHKLAACCWHVTAVDVSPTALSRAKERLKSFSNITFVEGNIRILPFKEQFDAIIISEVLYYINRAHKLTQEFYDCMAKIAGLLAPGGRLILVHGFGNEDECNLRKKYREIFETHGGLKLQKELVGGDDPRKVKYLISLLRKP